jgi:hypothetical protein
MRHWRWVFVLVGVFLLGDRFLGGELLNVLSESRFRYSRMYRGEAEAALLLVGNSRGLAFYQPYISMTSGKTTFNMSYNGLPVDLANVLVQDYLDRYKTTERMLVDITMCDRQNDQLLAGFLAYGQFSERLDALIQRKLDWVWWAGRVSWLFRANNEVFQRGLYYRKQSDEDWLLDRVIQPAQADSWLSNPITIGPDDYLVPKLAEMVAFAQDKGIEVYLVIGPYYPGYQVQRLDALKQVVEERTGLPVYDYRSAIENPLWFGDLSHLNKSGSRAYIDLLRKDGVLP